MKAYEILSLTPNLFKVLSGADIRMDDWKYIDLFREYMKALERGEKVSATITLLAEEYHISEAGVWRIIRRFRRDVSI